MTSGGAPAGDAASGVQRPDTDDYDLLTFGEVEARIAEELATEAAALQRARAEQPRDPERVRRIEERIELLTTNQNRYRQQERTNESFARRFGSISRQDAGERPQWL